MHNEAYRAVLEALPTGVYLVDRDRKIVLWSDGAEQLTGYLRQEVVGRSCREDLLIHCDENHSCVCGIDCPLQQTMNDGNARLADLVMLHKDGSRVPVRVRAVPVRDDLGAVIGAVECFDRRTVLPTADPQLRTMRQLASLDCVTGLPDRTSAETRLLAYLANYAASPIPFGVLSMAVDGLELLRHRDGLTAVQAVLHATAQTLSGCVGPDDMVSRWSDDRLLAVVTGCTASTLLRAAEGMKRLVSLDGVPWWGERVAVTLSMGGAIIQPEDTVQSLVTRAEAALERSLYQQGNYIVVV